MNCAAKNQTCLDLRAFWHATSRQMKSPLNSYANLEGFRGDFVFLARGTCLRREGRGYGRQAASPYIDNPDASGLVATKPELREGLASRLREYKAVYVQSDAEIGLFSDEVVVNCAP